MFKGHPKGLLAAALSNMGERFGYYIMNAVLVLFLCSKFGLAEGPAGTIYSFFYAGIYILSLAGGYIADRTQNYKGTSRAVSSSWHPDMCFCPFRFLQRRQTSAGFSR